MGAEQAAEERPGAGIRRGPKVGSGAERRSREAGGGEDWGGGAESGMWEELDCRGWAMRSKTVGGGAERRS